MVTASRTAGAASAVRKGQTRNNTASTPFRHASECTERLVLENLLPHDH